MSVRRYLPSTQFLTIIGSLVLSGGLVLAAQYVTAPRNSAPVALNSAPSGPLPDNNWEATLNSIEAADSSSSLPAAPDPATVQDLLNAATTNNLTDSIGRTLLINVTNAQAQGMGGDIPTQDQIVAAAAAQVKSQQTSPSSYTAADLTIVPTSNSALRTYGNAVMQAFNAHPDANQQATFLSIDAAVEGGDKSQGAVLAKIGAAYKALAISLSKIPVPQTLAPLHLEVINGLLNINAAYADMQMVSDDPVRGLVGLKTYQSLTDEEVRLFTNIAQELSKDGILFNKDEPGSAWSAFLTSS